jgi:hypothetical protein
MILYRGFSQKFVNKPNPRDIVYLGNDAYMSYHFAATKGGDHYFPTDIYLYRKDIKEDNIYKESEFPEFDLFNSETLPKNIFIKLEDSATAPGELIYAGHINFEEWEWAKSHSSLMDAFRNTEDLDDKDLEELRKYGKIFDSLSDEECIKLSNPWPDYPLDEGDFEAFYILQKIKKLKWNKPKLNERILSFNDILKLNTKYL